MSECNCKTMCFPDGLTRNQKHHKRCDLVMVWVSTFAQELKRRCPSLSWCEVRKTAYLNAEAIDYDVGNECPIACADNEIDAMKELI